MTRRSRVGPKVKLSRQQPLPEPPDSMTILTKSHFEGNKFPKIDSQTFSPFAKTTAGDKFQCGSGARSLESDFNIVCDGDDEDGEAFWQTSEGTGSSLGQSVASFMSWSDEIEVETTKKVQELVDQMEHAFYGEDLSENLQGSQLEECQHWREKFPHLRIVGTNIQPSSAFNDCDDTFIEEEEEIIASHGSYEESTAYSAAISLNTSRCDKPYTPGQISRTPTHLGDGQKELETLRDHVRESVKDEIFSYLWPKVIKSLEPALKVYAERTLSSRTGSFQSLNNIDLGESLSVSQKSLSVRLSANQTSRLTSRIPKIMSDADKTSEWRHGKTLDRTIGNSPHCSLNSKSPCHNLPSVVDHHGRGETAHKRNTAILQTTLDRAKVKKQQGRQVSVVPSPTNWSRHVTLPPIENLEIRSKASSSPRYRSNSVVTTPRNTTIDSRPNTTAFRKMSLSPIHIPSVFGEPVVGLSRLELAKQLLETHHENVYDHSDTFLISAFSACIAKLNKRACTTGCIGVRCMALHT
uniref:DUF3719 domain-containing protein n=1 Tax=Timema monikensis TaxID=170555 RepID=A0A7R9HQK8_9NEOP|nr:unnamed protein product [Timema monikensis]